MSKISKLSLIIIVAMITSLGTKGQEVQKSNSWNFQSNLLGFTLNNEQILSRNLSLLNSVDFKTGGIWFCPTAVYGVALEGGARYYLPRSYTNTYLSIRTACNVATIDINFNTADTVIVRPMIGIGKNVSRKVNVEVSVGYDVK